MKLSIFVGFINTQVQVLEFVELMDGFVELMEDQSINLSMGSKIRRKSNVHMLAYLPEKNR